VSGCVVCVFLMLLTLMSLVKNSILDFDRFRSYWHTFDRKLTQRCTN